MLESDGLEQNGKFSLSGHALARRGCIAGVLRDGKSREWWHRHGRFLQSHGNEEFESRMLDDRQLLFRADKMTCQATKSFYIPKSAGGETPLLRDPQTCRSLRTEALEICLRRTQETWTGQESASPSMVGWERQTLKPYQCQSACQFVTFLLVTQIVLIFC
jgi:hypothetical protein